MCKEYHPPEISLRLVQIIEKQMIAGFVLFGLKGDAVERNALIINIILNFLDNRYRIAKHLRIVLLGICDPHMWWFVSSTSTIAEAVVISLTTA